MTTTTYHHVGLDAAGVPHIVGTTIKVVEIVLDQLAHHWSAEEIQRQHPQLTLAQVHSALAYYFDHQNALDRDIEDRLARADTIFANLPQSSVQAKLRAARQRP